MLGTGSAQIVLAAVRSSQTHQGTLATLVSVVTLIVGATTVFAVLETSLELMWGIDPRLSQGWRGFVRTRLMSLGVILALGFLLLVSLSITTALNAVRGLISHQYAGFILVTEGFNVLLSLAMSTSVVALIYQYMPARRLAWTPVLYGALVTALLFHLGRWAIGLYLAKALQPSAFGAAASFVALLLWLYYSAQIFLFGAELTACLANAPQPLRRFNLKVLEPDRQGAEAFAGGMEDGIRNRCIGADVTEFAEAFDARRDLRNCRFQAA